MRGESHRTEVATGELVEQECELKVCGDVRSLVKFPSQVNWGVKGPQSRAGNNAWEEHSVWNLISHNSWLIVNIHLGCVFLRKFCSCCKKQPIFFLSVYSVSLSIMKLKWFFFKWSSNEFYSVSLSIMNSAQTNFYLLKPFKINARNPGVVGQSRELWHEKSHEAVSSPQKIHLSPFLCTKLISGTGRKDPSPSLRQNILLGKFQSHSQFYILRNNPFDCIHQSQCSL